jgi:type II secretory pathway pseudopilin PulG
MKTLTILIPMHLAGQGESNPRRRERGYAMVALIMAITVMAIAMTVAMPVWKHAAQREKEEELVFRGEQYVHAISLFQRKYANAFPPSIDILVQQKFLRKKYKDPITNDDFVPLTQASQQGGLQPGAQPGGAQRGSQPTTTQGGPTSTQPTGRGAGAPGPLGGTTPGGPGGAAVGGIIGVTSKSTDSSIRLYKGRSHYNEWAFVYTAPVQAPGSAVPGGRGQPPQPGQQGQPGQRGQPPFPGGPNGPGRGNFPPFNPGSPGQPPIFGRPTGPGR